MFSSLRARLALSFGLLIGVMLILTAAALVISFLRNPQVYQSVLPLLRQVEGDVYPQVNQLMKNNPQQVQGFLVQESKNRQVRLALVDPAGAVIADSAFGKDPLLPALNVDTLAEIKTGSRPALVRDRRGRAWVYTTREIGKGYYLFVGVRITSIPVVNLLRNEVIMPLIVAGGVAILTALALALWMGRWISAPLQRMEAASHALASGQDVSIPEEGPDEVRELARALNHMNSQVHSGQQSQRDFIANVSHELKTPLTSVQGFAQAILDGAVQSPQALRQAAEVIYTESNRMHRLVMDLLALAKLEGGTADLQHTPVDLAALLRTVVTKFEPQARQAQVGLSSEIGDLPSYVGDADRLAQVFTNLVDNALKYTSPGGQVHVKTSLSNEMITVEVSDTGKGIAPEDRERIFERFYQIDKSRRGGVERGVGLGLPIARQIVIAHGGKIWVDSQPGKGSRMVVQLPLVSQENRTSPGLRRQADTRLKAQELISKVQQKPRG